MRSIPLFLLLFVALRIPAAPFVVTSLKDSGRGTLREALSQGNRHITFQVGGTIRLKKLLEFRGSDVVIDGASAPGLGITVRRLRETRQEVFMPLKHVSGEAQVDFGHALVRINGQLRKVPFFVMTLPHSDAVFVAAFERECAETFWIA